MKVKELIKELKTMPADADIFLSSDEEGNSYSTLQNGYGYNGSLSYYEEDRVLLLIPWSEGLEWNEVCPIQAKKDQEWISEQMRKGA